MFHNCRKGMYFVVENICKDMQTQGKTSISHKVVSTEYVMNLYSSNMLFKDDPLGFLTHTIFDIALVTSWRPVTSMIWIFQVSS